MYRALVAGLLTAVATAASGLLGLVQGAMIPMTLTVAAVIAGASTYLAALKKMSLDPRSFWASECAESLPEKVPL